VRSVTRTLYPLGFPVEIASDSRETFECAEESWGHYSQQFKRPPVRVTITVRRATAEPAPEPSYHLEDGRLTIFSDADHHAVCDLRSRSGYCHTSPQILADRAWFRWFYLEAMVYTLLTQEDIVPVHAACVAHQEKGVLLCGVSGAGKSTLAYACARAGWTFVADDAAILLQGSRTREVLGKPFQFRFRPEAVELFPELRGHGTYIRPNGKPTVEVPTDGFPIQIASRCRIEKVVFLNRNMGGVPGLHAVAGCKAVEQLLGDAPAYAPEVRRRHEETILNLITVPAYELEYSGFEEALELLSRLVKQ